MMYAYPLFAFVYLECQSWNMKWGSTDTIIVDVQDIKAKFSLKQDRAGFFWRKSSKKLFSISHWRSLNLWVTYNKVLREIT
jgi:hypothetical protein